MGKKSKGFTEIKNRVLGQIRALGSLEVVAEKKYWWIQTGFFKQLLSNTIKYKTLQLGILTILIVTDQSQGNIPATLLNNQHMPATRNIFLCKHLGFSPAKI